MPDTSPDAAAPRADQRYRQATGVLVRRTLDTVLILPPGATDPILLSGSSPALWQRFAEPASFDGVVEELHHLFGVPLERLRTDFEEPFRTLVRVRALMLAP